MRTDNSVSRRTFRYSSQWRRDAFENVSAPEIDRRLKGGEIIDGRMVVHSLSGHERNHLFVNGEGKHFDDISLVSGIDTTADSRSFGLFDYDHDGQPDIALVNANTPLVNLYRNTLSGQNARPNNFVAVRFEGGNQTSTSSTKSCRDGYGAIVTIVAGGKTIKREHRCGEGYGAQNSRTMLIGIGDSASIDSLSVKWPSGLTTTVDATQVLLNSLVTVREADDVPYSFAEYVAVTTPPASGSGSIASKGTVTFGDAASLPDQRNNPPKLRLYMTMATWCVACKEQHAYLQSLAKQFDPAELEIIGIPIDPNEDAQVIQQYFESSNPPYRQILQLTAKQRRNVKSLIGRVAPPDAIPGSLVTDGNGTVLGVFAGVPTVSELRKLLFSR